jgi:hypothetical protein
MAIKIIKNVYKDPYTEVIIENTNVYRKSTGQNIRGYGWAKRIKTDEYNEKVGFEIALLRAKENMRETIYKLGG